MKYDMQQPLNVNNQLPLINTPQQNMSAPLPSINAPLPSVNAKPPSVNELLTDPRHQSTRDAEILKTFELAKLTRDEAILVLDKINNHQALEIALNKLKPFIHT
jgi:hypothetical protein